VKTEIVNHFPDQPVEEMIEEDIDELQIDDSPEKR
jgi:hypothetical protein